MINLIKGYILTIRYLNNPEYIVSYGFITKHKNNSVVMKKNNVYWTHQIDETKYSYTIKSGESNKYKNFRKIMEEIS